jgi:hypothetical protein
MSSEDEHEVVEETRIRARKKRRTNESLPDSPVEVDSPHELNLFTQFDDEAVIFKDVRKRCFEYCYSEIEKAARKILLESAPIDVHIETINFIQSFINDWRVLKRQRGHFLLQQPIAVQHITNNDNIQRFDETPNEEEYKPRPDKFIVAELNTKDCDDLQKILKKLMGSKFPCVFSDDVAKYYSIKDVVHWYKERIIDNQHRADDEEEFETPPVVIVYNDAEQMNHKALYKWFHACSNNLKDLPICHVLRVNSAKVDETMHQLLQQELVSRVNVRHFSASVPSSTIFYTLLDELFIKRNDKVPVRPNYAMLDYLVQHFNRKSNSVETFLNQIRFMLLDHFNKIPTSFLAVTALKHPNDSVEFGNIFDKLESSHLEQLQRLTKEEDVLDSFNYARNYFALQPILFNLLEKSYRILHEKERDIPLQEDKENKKVIVQRVNIHMVLLRLESPTKRNMYFSRMLKGIDEASEEGLMELFKVWLHSLTYMRNSQNAWEKECEELEGMIKDLEKYRVESITQLQAVENASKETLDAVPAAPPSPIPPPPPSFSPPKSPSFSMDFDMIDNMPQPQFIMEDVLTSSAPPFFDDFISDSIPLQPLEDFHVAADISFGSNASSTDIDALSSHGTEPVIPSPQQTPMRSRAKAGASPRRRTRIPAVTPVPQEKLGTKRSREEAFEEAKNSDDENGEENEAEVATPTDKQTESVADTEDVQPLKKRRLEETACSTCRETHDAETNPLMLCADCNLWNHAACAGVAISPSLFDDKNFFCYGCQIKHKQEDKLRSGTNQLHCYCRQPSRVGPMQQCTQCSLWYHKKCIGKTSSKFTCLYCDNRQALKLIHEKSKIEDTCNKCKKMDGQNMIGCDSCYMWYHFPCVGLTEEQANAIVSYQCDSCVKKAKKKAPKKANAAKKQVVKEIAKKQVVKEIEEPKPLDVSVSVCNICCQPDNLDMVACDKCDLWFHYGCAGTTEGEIALLQYNNLPYYCRDCDTKTKLKGKKVVKEDNAERTLTCEQCARSFDQRSTVVTDREFPFVKVFYCDECTDEVADRMTIIKKTDAIPKVTQKSESTPKPVKQKKQTPARKPVVQKKPRTEANRKRKAVSQEIETPQSDVEEEPRTPEVEHDFIPTDKCPCGKMTGVPMVECIKCKSCFHYNCGGLSADEFDHLITYYCSACETAKDSTIIDRRLAVVSPKKKKPVPILQAPPPPIYPEGTPLYCFCRRPDDSLPMIACDGCNEWYHYACIDMTPAKFKKLNGSYYCHLCKKKGMSKKKTKTKKAAPKKVAKKPRKVSQPVPQLVVPVASKTSEPNRYSCVCKKPWQDSDMDMIQCETCEGWFHFNCIGLQQTDLQKIRSYACEECEEKTGCGIVYKTAEEIQEEQDIIASLNEQMEKKPPKKKRENLDALLLEYLGEEEELEPATPKSKSKKQKEPATPRPVTHDRKFQEQSEMSDTERRKLLPIKSRAKTFLRTFFDDYMQSYKELALHSLFFASTRSVEAFFRPFVQCHRTIMYNGMNWPAEYISDEQADEIDIATAYNAYALCGEGRNAFHLCEWLYAFARLKRNEDVSDDELYDDVQDTLLQKRFGLAMRSLMIMGFVKFLPKPLHLQKLIL